MEEEKGTNSYDSIKMMNEISDLRETVQMLLEKHRPSVSEPESGCRSTEKCGNESVELVADAEDEGDNLTTTRRSRSRSRSSTRSDHTHRSMTKNIKGKRPRSDSDTGIGEPSTSKISRPDDARDMFDDLSSDDTESVDDSLTALEGFYTEQDTFGAPLEEKLGLILDTGVCKSISEMKKKELSEKYLTPSNCKNLRVPRTNNEVWKELTKTQRRRDMKFQRTQGLMTKNMIASAQLLDLIRKERKGKGNPDLKEYESRIADIIQLS